MEFHYDVIHKNFEGRYHLLYSDTDSLVYCIYHHDIYEWIKNNTKYFDLSDSLRPDMKNTENNKVVLKMKDELRSLVMKAWLALNPKVYSFNCQAIQDKHEKQLKDKLVDVQVEKGKSLVYRVIDKTGKDEEHQLILKNKKTLKGVSKAVVKNEITHEDYEKVYETNEPLKKHVTSLRSFNHNVVTYRAEKVALTSFYDKMCMTDANTCVPFGYIPK